MVKSYIKPVLQQLKQIPVEERVKQRIEKFGKMGFWEELNSGPISAQEEENHQESNAAFDQ